ncbi:MAG: hypothetical protein AB8B80_16710 [Marinicellaceae bacterium]
MLNDLQQYIENGQATYANKGYRGLNLFGKVAFFKILSKNNRTLRTFYKKALSKKECYIGPFVGEFGNFLLHIVPFLSHLHKIGVKVNYCGLELHRPFLVDEENKLILHNYTTLRDFLKEVKPSGNNIKNLPDDIQKQINGFALEAKGSKYPFLNIYDDKNLYWYSFRNWQLKNKQHVYDLSKVYRQTKVKNKLVIFPRKMIKTFTPNNGGVWDYTDLALKMISFFDEIVFIGHPELSSTTNIDHPKIRHAVSGSNYDVLSECASARMILTQHSGAMHVGAYTKTPVLLIFKGANSIKGLDDSIRFRKNFNFNDVEIAFAESEIISKIK